MEQRHILKMDIRQLQIIRSALGRMPHDEVRYVIDDIAFQLEKEERDDAQSSGHMDTSHLGTDNNEAEE